MSFFVRRVVTGHSANGRAVVESDELMTHEISFRPGMRSHVAWATDALPADNTASAAAVNATTVANGSVFRIIQYAPGVAPRNHRTESIDYAVVLSGEIDMELDDGAVVHLKAGDLVVQRGTIHNWVNNGREPCVIAFVLIAAMPLVTADSALVAVG